MKLDRKEPICGLRPAALKKLLGRYCFTTPKAMQVLGLDEPDISQTMLALRDEGWIEFIETADFIDHWRIAPRGQRLTATKLIKRFAVAEGRKIVDQVIATSRDISADPNISHRVTEVRLFGSVLTAAADDDAGDVDLVVTTERRALPKNEMDRIEALEDAATPTHLGVLARIGWAERETRKKIKAVSGRISLHPDSDLRAIGAPFKTVFCFDVKTEMEVSFDTSIRSYEPEDEADAQPSISAPQPTPAPYRFTWPKAPNEPGILDFTDGEYLQRAQHMWVRGASIGKIAKAIRAQSIATQAYLASRSARAGVDVTVDQSLRTTVAQALPPHRSYYANVSLDIMAERDCWCDVTFVDPETFAKLARVRRSIGRDAMLEGRCDLFPIAEAIVDAAWLWLERMRSRSKGVSVKATAFFSPECTICPKSNRGLSDFRPLAAPMLGLLQTLLPVPRPRYAAYAKRLEIEFGGGLRIDLVEGTKHNPGYKSERVVRKRAGDLWDLAKTINAQLPNQGKFSDTLVVYVSGYQLPNDGDIEDEVYDGDEEDWL